MSQISNAINSLVNVRYYTPNDIYYYTIDNRPLTDLDSNITTLANIVDAVLQGPPFPYMDDTSSTVNTITCSTPVFAQGATLNPGQVAGVKVANTNTGPATLNVNSTGNFPILSATGALQGGELVSGKQYLFSWSSSASSWLLLASTGGALPVGRAQGNEQAVQLQQALTLLTPTATATVTPTALNTIVQPSITAEATIIIEPGTVIGQRVRVYGGAYAVTVQPNVTSGSPSFAFPDGSFIFSWVIPAGNYPDYIEAVWDNVNWRCTTAGQTVVAEATQNNEAVNLGQISASTGATLVGYSEGASGSVTRTVAARLQESMSVLDFGADPTGATDSTSAIQAAINAAYNNSIEGTFGPDTNKSVYFPAGVYLVSSGITVPGRVCLTAEQGSGATLTTSMASGNLLSFSNNPSGGDSATTNYILFNKAMVGPWKIKNTNSTNTATALFLGGLTASGGTFIQSEFDTVSVFGFNTVYTVGNNACIFSFVNCYFTGFGPNGHVSVVSGVTNSGEKISYIACDFDNAGGPVFVDVPSMEFMCSNCSFDYNKAGGGGGTLIENVSGATGSSYHFSLCHFEWNNAGSLLVATTGPDVITIVNCSIWFNGSTAAAGLMYFGTGATPLVTVKNCKYYAPTAFPYMYSFDSTVTSGLLDVDDPDTVVPSSVFTNYIGGSIPSGVTYMTQRIVPPATATNQAVQLQQALTLLAPTATTAITPTAFNTIVQPSIAAAATITIEPGTVVGQRVRVYGGADAVTVQSNVTSGSPYLSFPDASTAYSWVIPALFYSDYIEGVWDGVNWRCTTAGQTVVAEATQDNAAPQLSQLFIGNRKAVFTANGAWTVPSYISTIWVSGCGGGGGGGCGGGGVSGGNGGGAGQSVIKTPISVTGGHSLSISIGASGSAGAAGNNPGGSGGNTVLTDSTSSTTLLTLTGGPGGGAGGVDPTTGNAANAASGGYPAGGNGAIINGFSIGGSGGSGPFGGGGATGIGGGQGSPQNAYGYGGGGGAGGGGSVGGAGSPGILIIEW